MNQRVAQRRARLVPGLVALTAAALLAAAVASPSAGASSQQPAPNGRGGPSVPTLYWTDCGDGFECATAVVPLDYRHPRGQTIELALIRKPAVDQANRIGSLFLNPGGPGGSGVEFVRAAPPAAFAAVSRFDFVGWDPRGVGLSRPLFDCGVDGSGDVVYERPQTLDPVAFEAEVRSYADACVAANPALAPHMSTANAARDLDLLRAAVGDEQLNYFGLSYGSVIGATYASMFPGRARAMVLDSPVDVQGWYDQPVERTRERTASFEDVLDRFFVACVAAGPDCGFGGTDPERAFDGLVTRLDQHPLPNPDPAGPSVNGDLVRLAAGLAMYRVTDWPHLADALVAAEAGDPVPMLELVGPSDDPAADDDALVGVWAADMRYDRRIEPFIANLDHAWGAFEHFWWIGTDAVEPIAGLWPVEDRGAFRGDIENPAGANPILILAVTDDPATPYSGAQRLVADLGNARLMTFESDGHGALVTLDPCLLGSFLTFVNDLTLPPEGTTCVDQRPHFPSASERSAAAAEQPIWHFENDLHPLT
jgi:pimeloyl-ACP methyl ester carboxylesterase